MQRPEYNTRMTDALITHEIMTFYGKGGIPGVTVGSRVQARARTIKSRPHAHARSTSNARAALCEAHGGRRAGVTDQCGAYAFKRAAPFFAHRARRLAGRGAAHAL